MRNNAIRADIIFPRHFAHGFNRRFQMAGAAFRLRIIRQVIRRAHLGRYGSDHFVIASLKNADQLFHQRNPVLQRGRGIAIKCRPRRTDRSISIVGPAHRNNGADVFCSRIYRIHRCRGCRGQDPCAIDIGFKRRIRHIQWLSFDLQQCIFRRANNARPPTNPLVQE